jgi:hypothetical protein
MSHRDWKGPGLYWCWNKNKEDRGTAVFGAWQYMDCNWRYKKTEHPKCPPDPPSPVKLLNKILDRWYMAVKSSDILDGVGNLIDEALELRKQYPELFKEK